MKSLMDYVLLEELGISNDVTSLVSKVKSEVGKDYKQNALVKDEDYKYFSISSTEDVCLFCRGIKVKFLKNTIDIFYYVIDDTKVKNSTLNLYFRKYFSSFDIKKNCLSLFLSGDGEKISWERSDATLQHEIEHWYQQYRKDSDLLSPSHLKKYRKHQNLIRSEDPIKRNIGMIYYYAEKTELDAIMNGLYGKIMGVNALSYIDSPESIMKDYLHYNNICDIQDDIELIEKDTNHREKFIAALNDIGKDYKSFMKLANNMTREYIKGFGRTVYKAKKDLDEKYKSVVN